VKKAVQIWAEKTRATHGNVSYRWKQNTWTQTKTEQKLLQENAHTNMNTCNTLTRFVVQRDIVSSGRFRGWWLVLTSREREAIVRTVRYEAGCGSSRDGGLNLIRTVEPVCARTKSPLAKLRGKRVSRPCCIGGILGRWTRLWHTLCPNYPSVTVVVTHAVVVTHVTSQLSQRDRGCDSCDVPTIPAWPWLWFTWRCTRGQEHYPEHRSTDARIPPLLEVVM
jgi:hypothetical protein